MDIPKLLNILRPGAQWSMGETYESLVWMDEATVKPSLEDLVAVEPAYLAKLEEERKELEYVNDKDMPSLDEKIDAILEGGAKLDAVKAKIAAVKVKHGK